MNTSPPWHNLCFNASYMALSSLFLPPSLSLSHPVCNLNPGRLNRKVSPQALPNKPPGSPLNLFYTGVLQSHPSVLLFWPGHTWSLIIHLSCCYINTQPLCFQSVWIRTFPRINTGSANDRWTEKLVPSCCNIKMQGYIVSTVFYFYLQFFQ